MLLASPLILSLTPILNTTPGILPLIAGSHLASVPKLKDFLEALSKVSSYFKPLMSLPLLLQSHFQSYSFQVCRCALPDCRLPCPSSWASLRSSGKACAGCGNCCCCYLVVGCRAGGSLRTGTGDRPGANTLWKFFPFGSDLKYASSITSPRDYQNRERKKDLY